MHTKTSLAQLHDSTTVTKVYIHLNELEYYQVAATMYRHLNMALDDTRELYYKYQ